MAPRLSLLAALALASCSGDGPLGGGDDNGPEIGDPDLKAIRVEVDYQPDAEPYTGSTVLGGETWELFQGNVEALFEGTGVSIFAPQQLSEMEELAAATQEDFTVDDILALSEASLDTAADDETRVFHVLWLDGYFADGEGRQSGVLGVSIGRTGVIAMFKPVIETLGLTETVRRFGEQATLIHEFGHAAGLVNNGVDMVADHQDEANGAHCDNDECVMYWANEGAGDLAEFVGRYITTGDAVLFDADCQSDVQASFD